MGTQGPRTGDLQNPEHGAEARKLYDDAQKMLARIREEKLLTLQGVAGIFAAVSRGDDIVVTGPKDKKYILPMLRARPRSGKPRPAVWPISSPTKRQAEPTISGPSPSRAA